MVSQTLELHYYLQDGSHAMNAHIRNKCEHEALAAFQHISEMLGMSLVIETEAHAEGGLREIWKFVSKPENAFASANTALVALLAIISTIIQIWNVPPSPDKEVEAINKEILKTTLEERRLHLEKLRKELGMGGATSSTPQLPEPAASSPQAATLPAVVASGVALFSTDVKVLSRRSNFYKNLLAYEKVTAVGLTVCPESKTQVEKVVRHGDFSKFVLKNDKLPSETVKDAVIEIVAPVIKDAGVQWKGIFQGETIGFAMKDDAFKGMVARREISFQAGNAIRCELQIDRKLDEIGNVVITGYAATVVTDKLDDGGFTETPRGRQARFYRKFEGSQAGLGFDDGDRSTSG
jgi:hypothetical protein